MSRITAGQKLALREAERSPLRRVTGGWLCRSGDRFTKTTTNALEAQGLLALVHSGKHGPLLVITAKGKQLLDPTKVMQA